MADILARAIDLKGDEINEKALNDYVFFTELAANCGLSVSQTNLAQHYLKQVTNPIDMAGYDNLKKVEFWLKKAAAQDYEPAIKMLSDLDQLFQWGKDNSNLT
jgi:TPR repeat protein